MANQYSMEIHSYISKKIASALQNKKTAEEQNNVFQTRYFDGQLHELYAIRKYMAKKIDLKTQTHY